MTLAETLLIVSSFCGMPTYGRLESKDVNTCRTAFFDCIGLEALAKAASLPQFEKDLGRKVLQCAKESKFPQ
jgi:hypothetical protein